MKKLINLIALVMLVSTNVLTPFSYAQVETPELIPENEVENIGESIETPEYMEEFPENVSNNLGEIERENQEEETPEDVLPDVQKDIETPIADETENVDAKSREVVQTGEETPKSEIEDEDLQGNEVEDDFLLQKEDETIIMQVQPGTTTTLLSGFEFNVAIKNLAGQSVSYYTTDNTTIQQIIQWTGNTIPLGVVTGELSVENSDYPVYARFTGGIIYYYTEAEKIYMNPNSSHMFYGMKGLTGLDLSNWNTSNVTNMTYIFNSCSNLNEINLDGRDFSNMSQCPTQPFGNTSLKKLSARGWKLPNTFSNMMSWFGFSSSIEEIDATDWDLENTTNISYMFGYSKIKNIKGLNTRKNTSNVTDMEGMFYGIGLTGLDLSGWDTSNVTKMGNMFSSALEEINLNGWDFRKVGGSLPMRSASNIKKFDMENTKFSGSMSNAFNWLTSLEEVNLSGADVSSVTNMSNVFSYCENLKKVNLQGWGTNDVSDMSHMFENCSSLKKLDLSDLYTKNVTDMSNMFYGCSGLTSLDLSAWDTSNVTNMGLMFYNCSGLTNLDLSSWDTSNVSNLGAMFYGCSSLTKLDLSGWDTSNVTNIDVMFYNPSLGSRYSGIFGGCNLLEELNLSGWDFRKINNSALMMAVMGGTSQSLKKLNMVNTKYTGNAQYAFGGLNKLEELNLNGADTSNVTSMNAMFNGDSNLKNLDLSSWDTSNVTNMGSMFGGCSKLEEINLSGWDFRNISNASLMMNMTAGGILSLTKLNMTNTKYTGNATYAFGGLNKLEELNLNGADTSNVTSMNAMFNGDSNLKNLDLSSWDTSNVTNMGSMFGGCSKLEEINLSGWDFRNISNASLMMNMTAGGILSLTKLNMTNTKYTGNATYAFGGLNKLEELNLNGADTSNVTSMNAMFNGDSNLKNLDLSSWDTSNVTNMGSMFGGCSKLEEINLSGWDFRNISNASLMMNMTAGGILSLTKLNMTNTKYTGNASYAFGGLNKLEELNLNGADTSNVTSMNAMFNGDSNLKILDLGGLGTSNVKDMSAMFYNCSSLEKLTLSSFDTSNVTSMGAMFYGCSGLNELDLTNFNTPKVTVMGQMFFNTPNLKTIYASENFVTTALSGDTSSKDMFSGTTSVIGGNGTKFDPNYIDEEYAKIDKVGQTGYFTDKNAINVKFINTLDGTETTSTFAKGQKLTPPSVNGYHVAGGYLDEEMTQAIDLNKGVDTYTVIYVKYDRNGSSGGGGGGGSKSSDTQDSSTSSQNNKSVSSGSTAKDLRGDTQDSSADASEGQNNSHGSSNYSQEFQQAYTFAKENGITTKDTIQSAQMDGKLTRIAMAKMLSQYAINVLGKRPDISKTVKFRDVTSKKDADYDNGVTLAYQLGIMGQNMKNNKFRPYDEVTRAEFVTALSRMLYGTFDGEYKSTSKYYIHHMEKLVKEGIINKTDPKMKELRGYVMIMLMRSAK